MTLYLADTNDIMYVVQVAVYVQYKSSLLFYCCMLLLLRGQFSLKRMVSKHHLWPGSNCISLSSTPSSEDGRVRVCPHTTVTLTCTANQQTYLTWRQETEIHTFFADDYETEETRVVNRGPYTLTLVSVDNVNGSVTDFTSTLEVMVNSISNGTRITCQLFTAEQSVTISKTGYLCGCMNYKVFWH